MSAPISPWNSLEIVKLAADFAIPLALALLGVMISRIENRLEQRFDQQKFSRSWKKEIFDEIASDLNLLYCVFNYVGRWRDYSPESIIAAKRRIDERIYGYSPILTAKTLKRYDELMTACFETRRGRGTSLLIRSNVNMFAESGISWKDEHRSMFVAADQRLKRDEFKVLYEEFRISLFKDLGFIGHDQEPDSR